MFGTAATLGFSLTDNGLEAALVRQGRKASKTLASSAATGDALLSGEDRAHRLAFAFKACLKKLPRVVRRADTIAALAVPDSLITEDVFTFDEFPKVENEARSLVSHRLSREMNALPDDFDVFWQVMSTTDGTNVRVRAIDRTLRQDIEAAAATAGLRLVRIDGWSGFASAEPQIANQVSGFAVWSDGAEWSLLCWGGKDAAGFAQTGIVETPEIAANDIVRLSLSYARRNDIPPGSLSADVPKTFVSALSAAAKGAGLNALALPSRARAAQVASWA